MEESYRIFQCSNHENCNDINCLHHKPHKACETCSILGTRCNGVKIKCVQVSGHISEHSFKDDGHEDGLSCFLGGHI